MSAGPQFDGIPESHHRSLHAAAASLAERFAGTFGMETIERFLIASYQDLAVRSTTTRWLPLLAEKFARDRLTALARVDGKSDDHRPFVLFLCTHNAGRSQMALGFFRDSVGSSAFALSGGSEPGEDVNPAAVAAMAERGIDISAEFPKPWTDEFVRAADVVITMGCGDACPIFPGKHYEDWDVADPSGLDLEHIRPIRDAIEARVNALVGQLAVPHT